MRALMIQPYDAELFQSNVNAEKLQFYLSHLSAFKRMWTAEGEVYWLRFLLAFKNNFEVTFMSRPEFQFIFDMDEEAQWQSFVFINIHKKFVSDSYSVTKTFMDHILVVAQHLESLKEPNRMRNPFYTKETREAFRGIFGTPEVDEDIPAGPITFLSNIYYIFFASVSTLLKRWLVEPDLSDEKEKNVDYTYFYWKPFPEWSDEDFWPSCFEKYLAEVYGDLLPKMLLTANIHTIFLNHDECACNNHERDINVFELFRPTIDDSEPFCMTQVGYLQPSVLDCTSHSNCYRKILHDPKCSEPYLCEGSNICILTCEKNQKKMNSGSKPTSFWKKVVVETFTCKLKNKRHVSTYAESHRTEVETFVHQQVCCKSKNLQEEHANDFMVNMCGDPELLNSFNQHKRKEEFKNRLRTKFHQKYCFDSNDFKDSSFCMSLFENARKTWIMGMLDEKLRPNSDKACNDPRKYADGSILNSMESAETTVAVGTNSILTGRIVLPSPKGGCSPSSCACLTVNKEPSILDLSESKGKPKSKRSRKKKKANANGVSNENNEGPSTSTSMATVKKAKESSAEIAKKKKVEISVPFDIPIVLPSTFINKSILNKMKIMSSVGTPEKRKVINSIQLDRPIKLLPKSGNTKNPSSAEKPIPSSAEKPIPSSAEKPIPSSAEKPIPSSAEKPIPSSAEKPIPSSAEKPIPSSAEKPMSSSAEKPMSSSAEKPMSCSVENTIPCSGENTIPCSAENTIPCSVENTIPCSVENTIPCSVEQQQVSHVPNHAQCDNKSETNVKNSIIIVKEPIPVNKSNSVNSQKECPLLNGDISKEAGDQVENSDQVCFGDCLMQNTIGHICSEAVCSLKACCQCCVFIKEKRELSNQTDTFQDDCTCVITEKPKKAPKPKINLIREAACLNEKTIEKAEEPLKNSSSNLKDNVIQIPKDGENSKKLTTLELNVGNGTSCDSQTIKSIEAASKDQYTVEESVVCVIDTPDKCHSNQKGAEKENPVQELVENDCGSQKTGDIIESGVSGSAVNNDSEDISETVVLDANEAIHNLKFENDEDKTVEDFLALIGILNKPSNCEEEIKPDSSVPSANHKSGDTEMSDKKLKFKTCAFCGKKEVAYKTFKRCAKCKVDNFPEQRYYCSRQCQVDDWQESHRDEHLKKS